MRSLIARTVAFLGFAVLTATIGFAQAPASAPAADPSGHWEGTVDVPGMPIAIEVDLTKNAAGALSGTFGQPAQSVRGLPLTTVTADGRTVTFVLKAGPEHSTFKGTLSEDGKTMEGTLDQAGRTMTFKVSRTGDAKVMAAPKSAPIAKELEGTWDGTIDAGARQMRVILKMANQADGTATGSIASPDGSGLEIPIGMTVKDKTLTVDVPSIGGSFVGTLNAEGTQLAGTWTQAAGSAPLVFKKAAK